MAGAFHKIPRGDVCTIDPVKHRAISQPEAIFRSTQAMGLGAVDIPSAQYVASQCSFGPNTQDTILIG
jgi:hypothetical protein